MAELVIFASVAMAGCAFLIYFLFAIWRDSRNSRRGQRVEIRRLSSKRDRGKLLHMHSAEDLELREKRRL